MTHPCFCLLLTRRCSNRRLRRTLSPRTYGYNGYAAHCRSEVGGDHRFAIAASMNLENNNAGVADVAGAAQLVIVETLAELSAAKATQYK